MADRTKNEVDDALVEMRRRYRVASDYWSPMFDKARDDIKFVTIPGNQWDDKLKARRGDRPMFEFPKLNSHTRQVINELRQSRPQGKVRGSEASDRSLAEIMQGICRNIESVSNADQAYDIAAAPAVQGGFGAWRLCTDYLREDDFDQDIFIRPIHNPFSVKFDPAAVELDRRDGRFTFVEELIAVSEHERRWPEVDISDFDDTESVRRDWRDADQVRIAEYWYKEPLKRELWALSTGAIVFADEAGLTEEELTQAGFQIVKRRVVDSHKVFMQLTNGSQFLTDPYEFPSKFIPIVPMWGNIQNVDGTDYWQGMVRQNKDQQRLHNVHRTAAIEAVAKAPKAPFLLKLSWIKGLESFWKRANAEDFPYLPIAENGEIPKRAEQAQIPTALLQLAALDNEDIKAGTGQFDASLGARSNETSGKAINARKQQGATATFNYTDNFAYAVKFTYEIMVDMIPRVYDTPRVVRTLGEDGGEKWKQLYQEVQDPATGQTIKLNDISKGKYDVVITVGPSYATQRMEAVDAFTTMLGQMGNGLPPPIASLMAYTAVSNMDLPGAEEVDEAFRKMLVAQGVLPPKEGEQPPKPPQPNPADVASAKKDDAQAQKFQAEAQGQQLENMATEALLQLPPPMPPPNQMQGGPMPPPMNQPPQGGFSLPQGPAPTGM